MACSHPNATAWKLQTIFCTSWRYSHPSKFLRLPWLVHLGINRNIDYSLLSYTVRMFPSTTHDCLAFWCTIVPSTEPLIERHGTVTTVITLEITVMEVVEIALANRRGGAILLHPLVKTYMPYCRGQSGRLHMKDDMYWMGYQYPVQQDATEIENMLQWMHRHA